MNSTDNFDLDLKLDDTDEKMVVTSTTSISRECGVTSTGCCHAIN